MNSYRLKMIALICMVFDHIGEFIVNAPIFFRWIGRLSAPIFFFCSAYSFDYTKNKKKYLIRLYLSSVFMSIIDCLLDIDNNIFRTIFSMCLILYLIYIYREKREKFKWYLSIYLFWQAFSIFLLYFFHSFFTLSEEISFYFLPALFGNIFYLEGGMLFVFLGILFYLFKEKPVKLALSYILFDIAYFFLTTTPFVTIVLSKIGTLKPFSLGMFLNSTAENFSTLILGLNPMVLGGSFLFQNYQWMLIFSLVFILFYNHQAGKKHKYFFYIFYPLHIVVLFTLGQFISHLA